MKQTTLGHYGLAKWIRWSEQQAQAMVRLGAGGQVLVYSFKDIQCIWLT